MPTAANNDKRIQQLGGDEQMSGLHIETGIDGLTAAVGGGQANALLMPAQINRITTVASPGNSVKLPLSRPGMKITLINHGVNPMQVFGTSPDTINDIATGTGVSQVQLSTATFICSVAGSWYAEGLATGFSGAFPTVTTTNAITATASGTQGTSVLLTAVINRVTVVASAGDSVKLPVAAPGMQITVINAQATNAMGVFPNTGDQVNEGGANAVFSQPAGKSAVYSCAVALSWDAVVSA